MSRIIGLEELPHALRSALTANLRVSDEVTVLPSAFRSSESGVFKNVVLRLSGTDSDLNGDIFSENWFSGISAIEVPTAIAEAVVRDPAKRARALRNLRDKIPSEIADSDLTVGPELDGDADDKDREKWECGFDSATCCVGLFSAQQSRAPEAGTNGMNRTHNQYYLICRAGGGVAAQTFHSRLTASLRAGKTLDQCLERGTEPGPQALRRVSVAGSRNRARILAIASECIGHFAADTISDTNASAGASARGAIVAIDVVINSLVKENSPTRSTWRYSSGCVDGVLSNGLASSSNIGEGFVLFSNRSDSLKIAFRNEACNSLPFATPRLATTREVTMRAAEAHKKAASKNEDAHPDAEWIKRTFTWKNKFGAVGVDVAPPSLWGSHASEGFLGAWSRELGLTQYKTVRARPEVVCVAAMPAGKLRSVQRHISG